jgi:putative transposase
MLTLEFKLAGTAAQYAAIDEGIRTVQFIRNKCLRAWMDRLPVGKNFKAMSGYTATLADEFPFAGRLGSQARQASVQRAWVAVSRFYENCANHMPGKKGYPRFRHDCCSIEYKETAGWSLAPDGKHITFSDGLGIGTLRLVGTRMKGADQKTTQPLRSPAAYPLASIKRVRIVRRADGYFCQFCVAVCQVYQHQVTGIERGIDVGLNAYYTDSEGEKVGNPHFFRMAEQKVARLQRQVSRKSVRHKQRKKPKASRKQNKYPQGLPVVKQARTPQKLWHTQPTTGQTIRRHQWHQRVVLPVVHRTSPPKPGKPSQNYQKSCQQLALAHLKVQRQREDCARKTARTLISSSDLIAYEDLRIRNLVRNHHLAKSINDAAWGRFLWWVQYYARMQAVPCIAVPPQFTSQDCSGTLPDGSRCPERVAKSLSVRTHACPRCGLVMDRDENAARLIKERGLALFCTVGQTETALPSVRATLGDW